jgi:DNA mismatch repair ATPase MutS
MLRRELDDEYLASVDEHLEALRFRRGLLMSAQLGPGNKGRRYRLLRPLDTSIGWREWLGVPKRSPYTYRVPDRDESGAQALAGLRVRGVNEVANALAQSADHILGFFTSLQWELGFYVGCLNLHEQLVEKHEPLCVPSPLPAGTVGVESEGLYDVGLTLRMPERTVGNTLEGAGKQLVMITGANQGGKSTFLRAVGVAQLMFQCGMYVGAESYSAAINAGVFTHFKRGEDLTMKSGKLDEELSRMSEIVDRLRPGSLLLLNESFAATNEREGSEVARQVVQSLLEAGVTIVYVTHLFHLTQSVLAAHQPTTLFLRAERASSGERSFRLARAAPLSTSFGEDIYRRIFADRVKASV